jgi:carbamoyltransferase
VKPGSTLGLSYGGCHDSSVAIVAPDGEVTFACALERLSRRKQDGAWPAALLELVDRDQIAVCALNCYAPDAVPSGPVGQRFHRLAHHRADYPPLEFPQTYYDQLARLPLPKVFVGHHLSHAASAYYVSGLAEATVLTYDAGYFNEPWFGGVFQARGGELLPVEYFPAQTNAKIASLYAIVTGLLGFSPLKHEGKVTGLAAFGTPSRRCLQVLELMLTEQYSELESAGRWVHSFSETYCPQFVMDAERTRELRGRFGTAGDDEIAASLQQLTEEHLLQIVQRVKAECPSEHLCLSGGLFANVKLNQRIHALWGGGLFVSPPMADDGTAMGAALYQTYERAGHDLPVRAPSMYLGLSFDAHQVQAQLDAARVAYQPVDRAPEVLAGLVAEGKTVAVFEGAMEFGPRALGHRSVLAPATSADVNDWLNRKLHRTEFMPFAPITRIEDAATEYRGIDGAEHTAEFMTITFDVAEHLRATCPGVVHVDGTARPQLVTRERNAFLHDLLTAYKQRTGLTSMVNTSFNIHEEPIICTPDEALRGFFEARLDYLYMEGFLVPLADNQVAALRYLEESARAPSSREQAQRELIEYLWAEAHTLQRAADDRMSLIDDLQRVAEDRLRTLERLETQVAAQARAIPEESAPAADAEAVRARAVRAEGVAEASLVVIREQERAIEEYRSAAAERLNLIHQLEADLKSAQAKADLEQALSAVEARLASQDDVVQRLEQQLVAQGDLVARLESRLDESMLEQQAQAMRRLEARLAQSVESRLTRQADSLRALETHLQEMQAVYEAARLGAEAAAEARLRVIEEQERALDAYRRAHWRQRLKRWVAPRLGVLYQYNPRPLLIPDAYRKVRPPGEPPLISIVTPSFNQGRFLERTAKSIFDQGYPRLEYIIQDGGSTDETLGILERYRPRLAHVASAKDNGFVHAINLGFAHATGEIMAYLNSDDLLLPGTLNYVASYFVKHPEVDAVYGHRVVIDEYDAEIGRWVLPPHDDAVLSWADYVPQETLFWRRRIWDRIGGSVDESFRFAVDWDLLVRLRDAGAKFARLPRFLGAFRVHPHQKTSAEISEVGEAEMARIRERCHGAPVSHALVYWHVVPYLRWHVVYNKLYRAGLLRY